jgi:hypothetical protein
VEPKSTAPLGGLWRERPTREKTTDHEFPNTVVIAKDSADTL